MGAAAARRLAADGFRVAVLSSSGKGEALADELGGFGVTGSNQSTEDLQRLVDGTVRTLGTRRRVGGQRRPRAPRAVLEITDEQWQAGMEIYLLNVVRPVRLVAPLMQRQGAGSIVNISTAWVVGAERHVPASAVFRAGLAAYTKIFANTFAADASASTTCCRAGSSATPGCTEAARRQLPARASDAASCLPRSPPRPAMMSADGHAAAGA